jgi:hypothetical protein
VTFPRPTRRALFGAAVALPIAATFPLAADAKTILPEWREMMRSMRFLNPNGLKVAKMAHKAGYRVEDIVGISLSGEYSRDHYPVMSFDAHNGGHHTVSPSGVMHCTYVRPI